MHHSLLSEALTFDENFWQQLSFSAEGLFNCSPAEFNKVKDCTNMVAGSTNKKKEKTAILIAILHKNITLHMSICLGLNW